MTQPRKNIGIEGAIKLPDSNFFLVPGSLWNKWKTVIHGEPEVDETETELLVDAKGKLILDEKGDKQQVFRRRSLSNPKDDQYYREQKVKVFRSYDEMERSGAAMFDLYVGEDGKLYDPAGDTWMENHLHEAVRELGGIFVNDTYMHLWKKVQGFLFLDGSFGSGKTTWAITHLLRICIDSAPGKFNCFYGRQQKEMATQLHKNIIEEIKRNHWEHLFRYSEADNGSKNIHCLKNGCIWQLFGCDDDNTIKGWNNPTHILVDEVDQISFQSFGMLQSRLRRPGVNTLFIGCFNACNVIAVDADDTGSWLWRYIFKEDSEGSEEEKVNRKVFKSIGLAKHHSDYLDNRFQNHHAYFLRLYMQAGLDINLANRFANGDWGTKLNAQLYYNRFVYEKHVKPASELPYNPALPLIVGFDENTQPYQPVLVAQKHGNELWFINEYAGYNPLNNLQGVAPMLIKDYGGVWEYDGEIGKGLDHRGGMYICGDATSKKEDAAKEKGQNYFTIAQNLLKRFKPEIRVQDANPNNKSRGDFMNMIYYTEIFGIKILISDKCQHLIKDLQNTMQNIKDEKKTGHKDKSTKIVNGVRQVQPYGHFCDAHDYITCEFFMTEYLTFQNGDMGIDAVGGKRGVRNSWEKDRDGKPVLEDSDDVKWNKKSRGDVVYGEVEDVEPEPEEVDLLPVRRRSKNSW